MVYAWLIKKGEGEVQYMDLHSLLLKSCSTMRRYSENCTNDFLAHNNSSTTTHSPCCDWYHGAWQYLRVLDCVSAPQWHESFYVDQLIEAIGSMDNSVSVLISGTADYSILHLIVEAVKTSGKIIEIDIVDLCQTPLEICKWYIEEFKRAEPQLFDRFSFRIFRRNIALFDKGKRYDIICTDAFLTRFSSDEAQSVVEKWTKLLKASGRIITTVRVHSDIFQQTPSFTEESRMVQKYIRKVRERYRKLTEEEMRLFGITENELSFLAARYIIKIMSNPLGNVLDLKSLFSKSGLKIIESNSSVWEVVGEVDRTDYYQIVAVKE